MLSSEAFCVSPNSDIDEKVKLSHFLAGEGKVDTSIALTREIISFWDENKKRDSAASYYIELSELYLRKGIKDSALINAVNVVSKAKEARSEYFTAKGYRQIGVVYGIHDEYTTSLSYFLKAKEIFERLDEKDELAQVIMNMGIVFRSMGMDERAIDHFKQSMAMSNNEKLKGKCFVNISSVYMDRKEFEKALEFSNKALKIKNEINDISGIALTLNNKANALLQLGRLNESEVAAQDALTIGTKLKQKAYINSSQLILAEVYLAMGNVDRAHKYIALADSNIVEEVSNIMALNKTYSEVYKAKGNYPKALSHYTLYAAYYDSLQGKRNDKELRDVSSRYELDNKEKEIALLTKDQEIHALQLEQRKQDLSAFRSALIIGGIATILLVASVLLIFFRYKDRKLMSTELARKNLQITRSINYAKRIQTALLPSKYALVDYFSESFIYYKPKEIVSGDFYWVAKHGNNIFLAVADCTGHGIPGAFISMIGSTLLNEIVNQNNVFTPSAILHELDKNIIHTLGQTNVNLSTQHDGMDIGIYVYDRVNKTISFAGANHSLCIVSNGKPTILKGILSPIGGYAKDIEKNFIDHDLTLNSGDMIYMYTDGYFDQFGGPNRKKYMSQRFRNLLVDISQSSCDVQKAKLDEEYNNWKGENPQTDDILIAGLKV